MMHLQSLQWIVNRELAHDLGAQLRWSKRHAGKYRWVLYEMWPLSDTVTHQRAVLVCEQNISQVKALEDQFKKQNQRWVAGTGAGGVVTVTVLGVTICVCVIAWAILGCVSFSSSVRASLL